jgi:cell division protein FtsL
MVGKGGRVMKRTTLLTLLLAAGLAVVLFKVKYEVIDLEDELAQMNREIVADREAVHVLKAEWSYLNDPARIKRLADRYLDLEPVQPRQIARFDDLPDLDDAASPQVHVADRGGR